MLIYYFLVKWDGCMHQNVLERNLNHHCATKNGKDRRFFKFKKKCVNKYFFTPKNIVELT
jgi:hypothetical protein